MTTQEGPTLGRCLLYYAPINGLPLDGGGGGGGAPATDWKIAFFRFSNVNFPTLGSPL